MDYPNFDNIAKNSDALVLAREEASLALLGTMPPARRGGWGRRLEEDRRLARTNPTHLPATSTELLAAYFEEPALAKEEAATQHGRKLSLTQRQQSMSMATALLAVSARDGVTNLYDDAGLAQLCTCLLYTSPSPRDRG